MAEKRVQFGNEGQTLDVGDTENLSSSLHQNGDAAKPDAFVGQEGEEQPERDQFDRREEELDRPS